MILKLALAVPLVGSAAFMAWAAFRPAAGWARGRLCEQGHHRWAVIDLVVDDGYHWYGSDQRQPVVVRAWLEVNRCRDCGVTWVKPTVVEMA